MLKEAQELYMTTLRAHESLYTRVTQLKRQAASISDMKELADIAYALRETGKLVEDQEKELRVFRETLEKAACALWSQQESHEPIRTAHVTATPDIKFAASVPSRKREPEAYVRMMQSLGVPSHLYTADEEQHPIVNIHWPGFVDYIARCTTEGLPLPDGVDPTKLNPIYKLILRGRKEVQYTPAS